MSQTVDTSNKEFQDALSLIQYTRQSVFLTGKAGTGKSTFLRYICENIKKKHVVLAPTGIAAINAGGSTLHSFFKLPFHPLLPDDPNLSLQRGRIHEFFRYTKPQRKLLEELELIIIDEISMVRADIIDAVDRILRVYSRNLREPFGGKQLLLVGDVFQLEPVVKGDEREILNRFYPTPYFFSARVFNQIDLVSIELEKVYRQTDKVFVSVLDHIRSNTAGAADLQLLNTRYGTDIEENEEDMYITLATRRDNVDYINDRKLAELPGDAVTFRGEVTGDFPESSLPTSRELVLKPGAQVIFIKNDFDRRWVNGTIGVVSGFDEIEETLYVITDDGKECDVKPEHWKNIRYKYNEKKKEIEEEVLGTFSQFPVRLAWAITVHKSQGLTFSRVVIDFTGGVFAGGQAYVALSRCTSLEGIQLKKPVNRADIFVRPEIVNFAERFNNRQAIDRALKQAQADVEYAAATKAFDKGDFEVFLNHFFKAIHSRYDIEKPVIQRLIRRKLGVINKLRDNNDQLKSQMAEQQKRLQAYAREYYLMGNESITLAHDSRAAIANYDKALELYPEYTDAWIRKGITLFNDGRYLEAEECLTRAVKLRPAEFKAVYNRGKLRLKQQETEGAIADLDKATTLKPEHAGAHELFGDALMQAGKEVEAALQWRLAEELRKNHPRNKPHLFENKKLIPYFCVIIYRLIISPMLLKLYEKNNNPQDLQQVVDILNDGGLIIYPTDTMYAIGCHGLKERAIERICRIKEIDPRKNNLSIICYDLSSISEYAKVDNNTFKLMKRNLPGAFTFILNGTTRLPKIFRNRKEVGIRMPNNAIIQEIARILDAPIMTTTLPHEAHEDIEYCTDPELIDEKFGDLVDLVIDGGIGGTEFSTIVDCTSGEIEVIRQGKGWLNEG